MKKLALMMMIVALAAGRTALATDSGATSAVTVVLDSLHEAASEADGKRYFGLFSDDAIFFGTDPGERWTVAQFKAYALPRFNEGTGWTYRPTERHIYFSADRRLAWFDEALDRAQGGIFRGTGVLRHDEGGWKIVRYNLSIPIPNALWDKVIDLTEQAEDEQE